MERSTVAVGVEIIKTKANLEEKIVVLYTELVSFSRQTLLDCIKNC